MFYKYCIVDQVPLSDCVDEKVDLLNDEFYVEMINMSLVDEGRYILGF